VSIVISQIARRLLSLPYVRRAWEARREAFRFRLGIAGRLGLAFAAVTVLATAANLIQEHGTQLIRTTPVVSPIMRPTSPALRTQSVAATTRPEVSAADVAPVKEVTDNLLIEAIDQFERAVERRADADSPEYTDVLKVAGVRLRDQVEAYLEQINTPGLESRARTLRPRLTALRSAGDDIIRVADERRAVLAGYWSHFESVDAQVKQALDHNNWKIFGRVISRQSLSALSRDLDDIRRSSTQLNTSGENAAMLDSLGQSATHFNTTLDQNAAGLERSQGKPWVEDLRKEFGAVLANRAKLAQLDNEHLQGVGPFERAGGEFAGLVRGISAAARKQARLHDAPLLPAAGATVTATGAATAAQTVPGIVQTARSNPSVAGTQHGAPRSPGVAATGVTASIRDAVGPAAVVGPAAAIDGTAPAVVVPAAPAADPASANIVPPTTVADPSPADIASAAAVTVPAPTVIAPAPAGKRALIASISALVLLILLVISVATVRSVVIPIRQFMTTTERLARGDDTARFTRGGIKELDALAASFNRMAASLADARTVTREYQGELESRVDERTRQLQHLAEHDPLTGLPNRRHLVAHLDASLQQAARSGQRVAVFFLDLDNFKNINDSMGHAFGDLVLKGVAERLREAAAPTGFAARIGGDEFTVIQEKAGSRTDVSEVGNALVRAFQKPLSIEGRELIISISGGASIYPDHERGSDALLRAADAALFRAKNSGRARLSLFSPELLEAASLKFSLEQGLRRALERGEFELWFQPEVSFTTLGTKLVEALLRWRLPDGQYVTPADFLSVAEDSGLIRSINDWVMRTAFRHAAEWHHGVWPEARVAINVSARQLLDTSFVAGMRELLAEYRLPPRCIEIELTETVLQTEAATIEVLRELRRLDISVALDDFGSGYSSLSSLERLPLTRVKLDRSLIDTIDTSARSLAIARAIIGLCENLGLEVTAEGVERPEQLALLLGNPAMTLQGYLLSHPVASQAVPGTLAGLRDRLQSLLIAVPPVKEMATAAARDAATLAGRDTSQGSGALSNARRVGG
jgi:diguanylate cyclase (GGDEF)-like protein